MQDAPDTPRHRLLDAILGHVVFDGWSEAAFRAAAGECGMDPALARAHCPRGAVDLAVDHHRRGDRRMAAALATEALAELRFRDRVARAVRLRLESEDREIVRRSAALFALPQNAPAGTALIWGTADAIWTALGDTSDDFNWYSKRASLSVVYSATVLYWLGDESEGRRATWDFLDRRIAGLVRFEKAKAQARDHPVLSRLLSGPFSMMGRIRAPGTMKDMPGKVTEDEPT